MRQKALAACSLIVFGLSAPATAQSVIAASRAIDWSHAGIPGGIPARTTQCGPTITAYAGTANTINTALAACPSGRFVSLGAGTFTLTSGIDFTGTNNVTVRGQGANSTFIVFTSTGASCGGLGGNVCMMGSNSGVGSEENVCDWTAGYAPGATSITLANCGSTTPAAGAVSNIKIGTVLYLDQLDEVTDNGQIWNCAAEAGTHPCANTTQGGGARADGTCSAAMCTRSQQQGVTVTGMAGSTLTISPGLYMPNWRSGQRPQAFFGTTTITGDGLENLSLDNTNSTAGHAVTIFNATNCWVKGIRSLYAGRSHIDVQNTVHSAVQDSYFYQSQSHYAVSYGIEWNTASDNLVQNNIFTQVTDSTPSNTAGAEGNIAAYNFAPITTFTTPSWFQANFYQHASGDAFNLWEGNIGVGYNADNVHGTHHFETLFRNWIVGWQNACDGVGCSAQTVAISLAAASRYFNVIGNVLGHAGYHTNYTCLGSASTCANANTSIYALGYTAEAVGQANSSLASFCATTACATFVEYDPETTAYLFRWGNYDTVNAAVRWNSSEVPSSVSPYGNAVPGNHTLPASLYLSAQPSWWGTMPYPAVGPDVTGGSGPGGFAYLNPAGNCYVNVMRGVPDGTGSMLTFNASTCYGAAPPIPSAPTNLRIIP